MHPRDREGVLVPAHELAVLGLGDDVARAGPVGERFPRGLSVVDGVVFDDAMRESSQPPSKSVEHTVSRRPTAQRSPNRVRDALLASGTSRFSWLHLQAPSNNPWHASVRCMRTVIHMVSGEGSEQDTSLAIAKNLLEDETDMIDDVTVVAQSDGLAAIKSGQESEEQVRSLMAEGVSFKACSNTLETMGLDQSDLVDGVETVPEGAVEVTRLESEGYAYMRP